MSTTAGRKHFTISELFKMGFKTELDGGFNYLSKNTDYGMLVTQDVDDITEEPTNKPIMKVYRLGDKENWDNAITEAELETLILPKI